jgi:regulatory protein YycI of two-component signal transduction system YycFG
VKADTREAFDQIADTVRNGMSDGGKYEYVKPAEKVTIEKKLDEMDKIFDEAGGTVAAMNEKQKIALFNAQETVNSILTLRDRDRVICKKEAPIGSHIPVTTCHSYAQEVEAHEGTKKQLEEWGRGQCREHCGGP